MDIRNSPCRNCNERSITCHGFCSRYKAMKELKNLENKKRREEIMLNMSCSTSWNYSYSAVKFKNC